MPEYPNPKLRTAPPPATRGVAHAEQAYAELDVRTNFSFLCGASHADELVYRAAELGYRAIGVADVNTVAGVVRVHEAAKEVGLKLLIGTRLRLIDAPDLLLWATDRASYGRLCRLLTLGKRRAEKGECHLYLADVLEHAQGLLGAVDLLPEPGMPCLDPAIATDVLHLLREGMGDRLSLLAACPYGPDDVSHLSRLAALAQHTRVPLLAGNNVHYHDPSRRPLQDVLSCIRHGCTIDQAGHRLFPNAERYLKSPAQMHRLFADYPEALARGMELVQRCSFSLDELRYEYPDELAPPGQTTLQYLTELTWRGAAERYPQGISDKVRDLLNHELQLIAQLKFESYFLTVYDMVRFARSRGILCQGRGSAANSAVCYCIGVTSVDPAKIDLLFERFISAARNEPPDIDIDFEHERREEVIQYIYEKYGRERAGMTAEVITYRGRSAVRDVGKAMGLSLDMVDTMASKLDWWHRGVLTPEQVQECGLDPRDPTVRRVIFLAGELLGFPRHLSQHVGGLVMTRGPLCELVPIENAAMPDRTVIEWDKDDIDSLGILKVDALALGMLTCISKAFRMVESGRDEGTGGRRDEEGNEAVEGRIGQETRADDSDIAQLQGSDCLATGHGAGPSCLWGHSTNAFCTKIRTGEPNVASGLLSAMQYCRGVWSTDAPGVSEIPSNRQGISGGIIDAVRTGDDAQDHSNKRQASEPPGRGGSNSSRPHPKPLPQNPIGTVSQATPALTTSPLSLLPSPLSPLHPSAHASLRPSPHFPFVPSSLRPCVPPSPKLALHTIPPDDPAVYDMLSDADTIGVFQVESRAQMSMLPRLKPNNFYDLVIEVAIVRPGPIQGNMVHPYLRRRAGLEPVSFPSKELEQVLAKTLGVPLFQEQAMRIAMVAAGFSADEADKLRRAMAAWRRSTAIEAFHDKIIRGMIANGYDPAFAAQCFDQIKGFGEYGFPESHAASFALLVYVSAWLKRYHPAAFCAALLNSQPMGFYMPAQIVRDAKEHGVEVREADVNESEWDCLLEGRDKGERHEGTEARRYEGKGRGKGRRDGGTKGRRDEGTEGRRDGGTEGKGRDGGTEGRRVGGVTSSSSPSPGTPGEGWGEGNIWAGASGVDARNVPKELWGIGGPAVRLGFREIKGFREAHARQIVQARAAGRFISVADFHQRTRLPVAALRVLAEADAFGSIGLSRRQALWEVLPLKDDSELCFRPPPAKTSTGGRAARANSQGGLFDMIDPRTGHPPEAAEPKVALPAMPLGQEVMTDYATIGLSLKQHPVALVRDELKRRKIITADQLTNLPHGRWVKVAGLVLLRQRPGTASGVVFETLEDETGIINLIVKPDIYDRFRPAARHAGLLQADGYLQRQDKVIHVLPKRLFDLSDLLRGYELRSRDFH